MTIVHEMVGPGGRARRIPGTSGFNLVDNPTFPFKVRFGDHTGYVTHVDRGVRLGDDFVVEWDDKGKAPTMPHMFCVGTGRPRWEPPSRLRVHGHLSLIRAEPLRVTVSVTCPGTPVQVITPETPKETNTMKTINWDKPLVYTNGTGTKLDPSKVIAKLSTGGALVDLDMARAVEYDRFGRSTSPTGGYADWTGLANEPEPVAVAGYRNIYADGSVGQTLHQTERQARLSSKVGKTRIGILVINEDGSTKTHRCMPYTRTSGYSASEWQEAA